jgi:uroporphyrin-III C-methyltransferase/precorrin-2 dehydrogenase/sirohydrochlorin ferrochelatase
VRFVTGHARNGDVPEDIDWKAFADLSSTTIFYMAAATAGEIATKLRTHGLGGGTPVVVACALSRPDQDVWRGTLDQLAARLADRSHGGPVLIGIGTVFGRRSAALSKCGDDEQRHPLRHSVG